MGVCWPEMETWARPGQLVIISGDLASMETIEMVCARRLAMEASEMVCARSAAMETIEMPLLVQQHWLDAAEMDCACSTTMV